MREFVAPSLPVSHEAPAPVIKYVAPTPADTLPAPAPVIESVGTPAVYAAPVPVIEYMASDTLPVPASVKQEASAPAATNRWRTGKRRGADSTVPHCQLRRCTWLQVSRRAPKSKFTPVRPVGLAFREGHLRRPSSPVSPAAGKTLFRNFRASRLIGPRSAARRTLPVLGANPIKDQVRKNSTKTLREDAQRIRKWVHVVCHSHYFLRVFFKHRFARFPSRARVAKPPSLGDHGRSSQSLNILHTSNWLAARRNSDH